MLTFKPTFLVLLFTVSVYCGSSRNLSFDSPDRDSPDANSLANEADLPNMDGPSRPLFRLSGPTSKPPNYNPPNRPTNNNCPRVYVRDDITKLNPAARKRLFASFKQLNTGSRPNKYDSFAKMHNDNRNIVHSSPLFLVWHRMFLKRFEELLQRIDSSVSLAYWEWTVNCNNPETSEIFTNEFFGGDTKNACIQQGSFAGWQVHYPTLHCLRRAFNNGKTTGTIGKFVSRPVLDAIIDQSTTYDKLRAQLENIPHSYPHSWIGGDMTTMFSPNDPIFYFHHGFIDKVFDDWQKEKPTERYITYQGTNRDGSPGKLSDSLNMLNARVGDGMRVSSLCYQYKEYYLLTRRADASLSDSPAPDPSAASTPTADPSAASAPTDDTSAANAPTDDTSTADPSAASAPTDDNSAADSPADDTSTADPSAASAPTDDNSAADSPADDTPINSVVNKAMSLLQTVEKSANSLAGAAGLNKRKKRKSKYLNFNKQQAKCAAARMKEEIVTPEPIPEHWIKLNGYCLKTVRRMEASFACIVKKLNKQYRLIHSTAQSNSIDGTPADSSNSTVPQPLGDNASNGSANATALTVDNSTNATAGPTDNSTAANSTNSAANNGSTPQ